MTCTPQSTEQEEYDQEDPRRESPLPWNDVVGKEVDSSSDNDGQPDAEDDNENREELEVIIIVDIEIDDNGVEMRL